MRLQQITLITVFGLMLVIPFWVVLSPLPAHYWSDVSLTEGLMTVMRLFGLLIFTSITQQLLTQEYRPLFNRLFPALTVRRYHIVAGTTTLLVALLHPLVYYVSLYLAGIPLFDIVLGKSFELPLRLFYFLGPISITLLICTASVGLLRRTQWFKRYWLSIHKLNYVLFITAFLHSWKMGSDLQGLPWLKWLWVVYALLVAYGFISKFYLRGNTVASGTLSDTAAAPEQVTID